MIKKILKTFIKTIILSLLFFQISYADEMDSTLKKLNLSGFFRVRYWNAWSRTKISDKFDITKNYQYGSYEDLFLRNRLYLKVLQNFKIRTVFDISSKLGKDDFSIGSGDTNLITRNVYAVFNPSENSELSIGLKPFSLPGGYIIARDASGIDYNHTFYNKKLKAYFAFINAYDKANDSFGNNTEPADYSDDIVTYAGIKAKISHNFLSNLYYVFEDDKYVTAGDNRKSKLHWIGLHNKITIERLLIRIGGIINIGNIEINNSGSFEKTNIMSGLVEFEASYKNDNYMIGFIAEGATGDPNDPNAGDSFQDIKASHQLSYIIVDNSGGVGLRESGESSLYGLYGAGINFSFSLFDLFSINMKYIHYRTYKSVTWAGESTTWLGDEGNIKLEYSYMDTITLFLTGAAFFPNDAYNGLDNVNYPSNGAIIELMIGAQAVY